MARKENEDDGVIEDHLVLLDHKETVDCQVPLVYQVRMELLALKVPIFTIITS